MYGTIARIQPKAGREEDMRNLLTTWNEERGPQVRGQVASYLFTPDHNPYEHQTLFLIAIFEDAEAYRANADDPAQDAWYQQLRDTLEVDPDWMDGTFANG